MLPAVGFLIFSKCLWTVVDRLARSLLLVVCVALVSSASAQTQDKNDDEVIKVTTDLLIFPIRVRDRRVQPRFLTEADLQLKDKDHAISSLYLYRGADRLLLVFALDQSGSLRDIISQQRNAALTLFDKFGEKSQVAVIRFADRPMLVVPFGRDVETVREAFTFPVLRNQHTAIFDAAAAAVEAFDGLPRHRSERRIAILISDGLDNASATRANEVIRLANLRQISFYVIHLPLFGAINGYLEVRAPAKGFRELAEKTGGKYFLVDGAAALSANAATMKLSPVFKAIEDDLKGQYLLGFYAGEAARDGRRHQFEVSMPASVDYQGGQTGYARTHKFFINMPGDQKNVMQ